MEIPKVTLSPSNLHPSSHYLMPNHYQTLLGARSGLGGSNLSLEMSNNSSSQSQNQNSNAPGTGSSLADGTITSSRDQDQMRNNSGVIVQSNNLMNINMNANKSMFNMTFYSSLLYLFCTSILALFHSIIFFSDTITVCFII